MIDALNSDLSKYQRDSLRLDGYAYVDGKKVEGRYSLIVDNSDTHKTSRLEYYTDRDEAMAEARAEALKHAGEKGGRVFACDSDCCGAAYYQCYPGLVEEGCISEWLHGRFVKTATA